MRGSKLFSFIEVDDTTPIQKLPLLEQFRVLLRRLSNPDREALKADDAETTYTLQLRANLLDFIHKATKTIRQGEHHSVSMDIHSKFLPVLHDVLKSPKITTYYTVIIVDPEIDLDVDYYIRVKLEVKAY